MAKQENDSILAVLTPIPLSASLAAGAAGAYVISRFVTPPAALADSFLINGLLEAAPYLAVILAAVLAFACLWTLDKRRLKETDSELDSIRAMDRQNFEMLVAQGFRRLGYTVDNRGWYLPNRVPITLEKDGEKIIVDCKQRWGSGQVDLAPVREVYAAMASEHADGALVVTSGGFTPAAQAFVQDKPIGLINGDALLELIEPVQSAPWENVTPRVPSCPVCERPMVKSKSRRGSSFGPVFWSCSASPSCKGARRI